MTDYDSMTSGQVRELFEAMRAKYAATSKSIIDGMTPWAEGLAFGEINTLAWVESLILKIQGRE